MIENTAGCFPDRGIRKLISEALLNASDDVHDADRSYHSGAVVWTFQEVGEHPDGNDYWNLEAKKPGRGS